MKEIRAWQILKLLMSLFLKKRIAVQQALETLTIEADILESQWKYCPDKILLEIPICYHFSCKAWTPLDILRPADERKLTQMESETENAFWLTQMEVDPGCYLNQRL